MLYVYMTLYTAIHALMQLSVPDAAACVGLIYGDIYIEIYIQTAYAKCCLWRAQDIYAPIYTVTCGRLAISIEKHDMLCVQGPFLQHYF